MESRIKLLFVGGDLSGIQKFIYNITSKKAMVSLKGRSAYLNEYMKKVCKRILDIPDIKSSPNTRTVYDSGGKFYLIVDDTPENINQVELVRKQVEHELWKEHYGQLGLSICYVPFSFEGGKVIVDGSEPENIGILWRKISEKFNDRKNQKYKELLLESYDEFFETTEVGEKPQVCAITGIEGKCVPLQDNDDEEDIMVLPSVREQIKLGQRIREKEHFKTFEEYADGSYLGILRMDVDRLGSLFAQGFESFDDYKAISGRLDAFFSGQDGNPSVLQDIVKKYDECVNIVYAGGDDLFAIGKWNSVIDFAAEVQKLFATHFNDTGITISGGISIVGPKFPISKSAELAGVAEETAKNFNGGEKNAFCLFGEAISWNTEFDYVREYKDKFIEMIHRGLSKGLLHQIIRYSSIVRQNRQIECGEYEGRKDLSYLWHTSYYMTRYIDRCGSDDVIKSFCKDLRDRQLINARRYELLSVAARWAELLLRNE